MPFLGKGRREAAYKRPQSPRGSRRCCKFSGDEQDLHLAFLPTWKISSDTVRVSYLVSFRRKVVIPAEFSELMVCSVSLQTPRTTSSM